MTGEKSPVPERKDPMVTPSTGSVAQFFAQAQAQQEQEDVSAEDKKPELDMKNRSGIEPSVNMIHPPGAVVTGGPPGIRLPNPVPNAPIQGTLISIRCIKNSAIFFLTTYNPLSKTNACYIIFQELFQWFQAFQEWHCYHNNREHHQSWFQLFLQREHI